MFTFSEVIILHKRELYLRLYSYINLFKLTSCRDKEDGSLSLYIYECPFKNMLNFL